MSDPLPIVFTPTESVIVAEQFWPHVEKGDGCWFWLRSKLRGYGKFTCGLKTYVAHRVAYALAYGATPALEICHRCHNPTCVRPDHLYAGTREDNIHDILIRREREPQLRKSSSNFKLTKEQVEEILLDPRSARSIAHEFGVHATTIQRIRGGKAYRHIPMPQQN